MATHDAAVAAMRSHQAVSLSAGFTPGFWSATRDKKRLLFDLNGINHISKLSGVCFRVSMMKFKN